MQLLFLLVLAFAAVQGGKQRIRFGNYITESFTESTAPLVTVNGVPVGFLSYLTTTEVTYSLFWC